MSDDRWAWSSVVIVVTLLSVISGLIAFDIVSDYRAGTTIRHLGIELAVMGLCALGVVVLWREYRTQRGLVTGLRRDMTAVRAEASRWRADARRVLGELAEAVDAQFDEWALTKAERDIAFALLRGLSHKEIARLRKTSERTVREQARNIYHKAGLDGRSALAAFFLWDLLPPEQRLTQ